MQIIQATLYWTYKVDILVMMIPSLKIENTFYWLNMWKLSVNCLLFLFTGNMFSMFIILLIVTALADCAPRYSVENDTRLPPRIDQPDMTHGPQSRSNQFRYPWFPLVLREWPAISDIPNEDSKVATNPTLMPSRCHVFSRENIKEISSIGVVGKSASFGQSIYANLFKRVLGNKLNASVQSPDETVHQKQKTKQNFNRSDIIDQI